MNMYTSKIKTKKYKPSSVYKYNCDVIWVHVFTEYILFLFCILPFFIFILCLGFQFWYPEPVSEFILASKL